MLENQLGAISLLEAVEMLRDLDCGDDRIIQPGVDGNMTMTVYGLFNKWNEEFPAAGIKPIIYCGGPPGRSHWYTGNLLMMVIDRILYKVAIGRSYESHMAAI